MTAMNIKLIRVEIETVSGEKFTGTATKWHFSRGSVLGIKQGNKLVGQISLLDADDLPRPHASLKRKKKRLGDK